MTCTESNGKEIKENRKELILRSTLENITLYAGEVRSLTEQHRNKIMTVELDFMTRILQITIQGRCRKCGKTWISTTE